MIKIAHISDIHIRNLKYHKQYRQIFTQLYNKLKEEKIDIIYIGGDLAHTKTHLSPEYFEMATDFLNSLADITSTYVILGNHDGNLKATHRQDAVTPIVEALNHPNLHLLKESGETLIKNNIVFNTVSIFDEENWIDPTDPNAINIALFRGSISGCKTDIGWVMKHGDHSITIFDKFDFAMLGDIHKTNQVLDKEGRIRYSGSLVQQNHGESNDKGFLIWEIENKEEFTVRHIQLENPRPFVSIVLTPSGRMPKNIKIPATARLRLISNNNLSLNKMRRALDIAKSRFKPESITFLTRASTNRLDLEDLTASANTEDLRDLAIQEGLLREYLSDYNLDEPVLEKIFDLNKNYNSIAEANEETARNINWRLKELEWDNLFNFGDDNYINFQNLNGTVGILGKNYSGKSSIIDSILYTLFNSTSKNERKNYNIINQNKDVGRGKLTISVGSKEYIIERTSEKYIRKLKGEETNEAKTDLEFLEYDTVTGELTELNGLSRADTDKKIRKMFGTLEDFLYTSMSSQLNAFSFINEGSTKRKEILAKFLDLEIFDQKFKLAKEDAADLRGALRRAEGREYKNDIIKISGELRINEKNTLIQEGKCVELKKSFDTIQKHLKDIEYSIKSVPAQVINIAELRSSLVDKKDLVRSKEVMLEDMREEYKNLEKLWKKLDVFTKEFDIDNWKKKEEEYSKQKSILEKILHEISDTQSDITDKKRKIFLLSEVPCGDEFPQCKFIRDAYLAKTSIIVDKDNLAKLRIDGGNLKEKIEQLQGEKAIEYIDKFDLVLKNKKETKSKLINLQLKIDKHGALKETLSHEIANILKSINYYEENKEAIENIEELLLQKEQVRQKSEEIQVEIKNCENLVLDLYKMHGSLEQKLENFIDQQDNLDNLRKEYTAYDLFMRCMHTSGISYDIIKEKLPLINIEIAKVLANIVDFEVFFEEDGKRLNIFIKHSNYDPRPIEMASGSEKTIIAMAIRLAMLSVSSLPKPSLFILDEPGTALDENNMEGFIQILDLVKSYFKTILLISHLESLKDIVDTQITIEKSGGYAHVCHK